MNNFVVKRSNREIVFINGEESFMDLGDGTFTLTNEQPDWNITPWEDSVYEGITTDVVVPDGLILSGQTLTFANDVYTLNL